MMLAGMDRVMDKTGQAGLRREVMGHPAREWQGPGLKMDPKEWGAEGAGEGWQVHEHLQARQKDKACSTASWEQALTALNALQRAELQLSLAGGVLGRRSDLDWERDPGA